VVKVNTQFKPSESDTTDPQVDADITDDHANTPEKWLTAILGDMFDTKLAPVMRELVKLKNTLNIRQETIKNATHSSIETNAETKDLGTPHKTGYTDSMNLPKRLKQNNWMPDIPTVIAIIGIILTVMQIQYQSMHDSIEASNTKSEAFKSEVLTEIKSINSKIDVTNQMFNQRLDDQNRYIDKATERKTP
jgi:hypothetical protein